MLFNIFIITIVNSLIVYFSYVMDQIRTIKKSQNVVLYNNRSHLTDYLLIIAVNFLLCSLLIFNMDMSNDNATDITAMVVTSIIFSLYLRIFLYSKLHSMASKKFKIPLTVTSKVYISNEYEIKEKDIPIISELITKKFKENQNGEDENKIYTVFNGLKLCINGIETVIKDYISDIPSSRYSRLLNILSLQIHKNYYRHKTTTIDACPFIKVGNNRVNFEKVYEFNDKPVSEYSDDEANLLQMYYI